MKTNPFLAVLLLLALVTVTPSNVFSQTTSSQAGIVVTNGNLRNFLENMGFEVNDLGNNNFEIFTNLGYKVYMTVALSTDESRIWLTTFFGEKVLSNYTADKLIKMLQSNWNTGVSFFALDGTKLKMTRPVENRNVTPVLLRKEIENQARNVQNTESMWNDKKQ